MAGIMDRIRLITKAELSELRDTYEDPEKAVNEAIAEAMLSYTALKKEAGEVFEGESQARERVASLTNEAERWHRVARKALAAGNESDARHALSRRQDLLDRLKGPQELYEQAHKVADAFRKRLAELEDGISSLQAKMALIKARESTIRATEAATSVADSSSHAAARALREQEEQAAWDLAAAEGLAEAQQVAESDPFAELATTSAAESGVDDALAALRAEIEAEEAKRR